MTRLITPLLLIIALFALGFGGLNVLAKSPPFPLPEFPHQSQQAWINSEPLSISNLKGNVTLIDIWTFACWNCYRSFPWLNHIEKKYQDQGFRVIGIHSPEFEYEKDRAAVVAKTKEFKLAHPVMMDNNFAYWKALENRYWPTYYLVDKAGVVRNVFIGETHSGTAKANRIEAAIERLLQE